MRKIIMMFLISILYSSHFVFAILPSKINSLDSIKKATKNIHTKTISSGLQLNLSFNSTNLSITMKDGFHHIMLNECELPEDVPGDPWLPAKYISVLIPSGSEVTSVDAIAVEELVANNVNIYPVQPPAVLSKPFPIFTQKNTTKYSETSKIPKMLAYETGTHVIRGYSFVTIRVNPIRYIPSKKQLYIAKKIELKIHYKQGKSYISHSSGNKLFKNMVIDLVVNPDMLDTEPTFVPQQNNKNSLPSGIADYLIITSSSLVNEFQTLANHRTSYNGLSSEVVAVEDIYNNYTGNDNQDKIRNCIKNYVDTKGTIYVVIGGDDTIVPDRDCYVSVGDYIENNMPTDLYYSGLDGTWDNDGDNVYGEANYSGTQDEGDLGPDVIVGRIPVRTASQASSYINKLIGFENNPPSDITKKMLLCGDKLWDDYSGSDRPSDSLNDGHSEFDSHSPVSDAEMWGRRLYRDGIYPYWHADTLGFFFDTLTSWDSSIAGDYSQNSSQVEGKFNEGWYHVFFDTHGSKTIWGLEDGSFSSSNAQQLNDYTVVVYTIACLTGYFDGNNDPALSEAFLRNTNGGALVYIGCSRYGWGAPDTPPAGNTSKGGTSINYAYEFYKELFNNSNNSLGKTFAQHKLAQSGSCDNNGAYRWVQFGLNFQGDPAFGHLEGGNYPEIDIYNSSTHIPDGGSVDFGSVTGTGTKQKPFTIKNTGSATLTLNGSPVDITGSSYFSISGQPNKTIPAGSYDDFTIVFNPPDSGSGTANAEITISHNDTTGNEEPYNINLSGSWSENGDVYEDWENGLDSSKWKSWGVPAPLIREGEGRSSSKGFDSNGDANYRSGVTSYDTFDLTKKPIVSFWANGHSSQSEWQLMFVSWSVTNANGYSGNYGQPSPFISIRIYPKQTSKMIQYVVDTNSFDELWLDEFDDIWMSYKMKINENGTVSFYRNDELKWTSPNAINLNDYKNQSLVVEGRSFGEHQIVDDIDISTSSIDDGTKYGNWAITDFSYEGSSDWDAKINEIFGSEYRVADWTELKNFYSSGGDLLDLFDGLYLTNYGASVALENNGDKTYSSTRYYFASRHEHNKPGGYMAHDNIDNYLISLGSWSGSRKILAVKDGSSQQVATPTISPNGGTYQSSVQVTLACSTSGAQIRYTIDGSTPTESSLTENPFTLTSDATIKAKAFKSGYTDSGVASANFTITYPKVSTPTISPNGGSYQNSVQVTLACSTSGATIRYTIDGTTPTESSLTENPFTLTESATVKVKAFKSGYTESELATATFTKIIPSKPDIQIPYYRIKQSKVMVGFPFYIEANVKNGGNANAGSSYIKLYLSTNTTLETDNDKLINEISVGSLNSEEDKWVKFEFNMPDIIKTENNITIYFIADSKNQITEENENNVYVAENAFIGIALKKDGYSEPKNKKIVLDALIDNLYDKIRSGWQVGLYSEQNNENKDGPHTLIYKNQKKWTYPEKGKDDSTGHKVKVTYKNNKNKLIYKYKFVTDIHSPRIYLIPPGTSFENGDETANIIMFNPKYEYNKRSGIKNKYYYRAEGIETNINLRSKTRKLKQLKK